MALSAKKAITDKRHLEKLDNIMVRPYKAEGEQIRAAAADAGQSLQGYILQAVRERMEREGK
jgi:predicted HicB family RNase H-like nuclease